MARIRSSTSSSHICGGGRACSPGQIGTTTNGIRTTWDRSSRSAIALCSARHHGAAATSWRARSRARRRCRSEAFDFAWREFSRRATAVTRVAHRDPEADVRLLRREAHELVAARPGRAAATSPVGAAARPARHLRVTARVPRGDEGRAGPASGRRRGGLLPPLRRAPARPAAVDRGARGGPGHGDRPLRGAGEGPTGAWPGVSGLAGCGARPGFGHAGQASGMGAPHRREPRGVDRAVAVGPAGRSRRDDRARARFGADGGWTQDR